MSTKPETQGERAKLIAALEEQAAWDASIGREDGPVLMRKAAALLAADGAGNGEVVAILRTPHDGGPQDLLFAARYVPRPDLYLEEPLTRPQQATQVAQPLTKEGGHED